jgi:hypothetical protein
MDHGASVKIFPTWVPQTTTIDFRWSDEALTQNPPTGVWAGDLAQLGGVGTLDGEWEWDPIISQLILWVTFPPGSPRRVMVAALDEFPMPPINHTTGTGSLGPNLVPATTPPPLTWELFPGF